MSKFNGVARMPLQEILFLATSGPLKVRPTGMILNDTGNVEFVAQVMSHGHNVGSMVQLTDKDKANGLLLAHSRNHFVEMRNALMATSRYLNHARKAGMSAVERAEIDELLAEVDARLAEIDTIDIPEGFNG